MQLPVNFQGRLLEPELFKLKVTASDGISETNATNFSLVVSAQPGNHAPILIMPIPNAHTDSGLPLVHSFSINTFADFDGDPLTYSASLTSGLPLPAWLTFNSISRTFNGTPSDTDLGYYEVEVLALDGKGGEATAIFDLGVGNSNNVAPSLITPIPDQSSSQGMLWSFQIPENTFEDADLDLLNYSAAQADGSPLPAWLTFAPLIRTFSGIFPDNTIDSIVYNIQVTVNDGTAGHNASDSFLISPWAISNSTSAMPAGSHTTIENAAGSGPILTPAGVQRLNATVDIKIFFGSDQSPIYPMLGQQYVSKSIPACLILSIKTSPGWLLVLPIMMKNGCC